MSRAGYSGGESSKRVTREAGELHFNGRLLLSLFFLLSCARRHTVCSTNPTTRRHSALWCQPSCLPAFNPAAPHHRERTKHSTCCNGNRTLLSTLLPDGATLTVPEHCSRCRLAVAYLFSNHHNPSSLLFRLSLSPLASLLPLLWPAICSTVCCAAVYDSTAADRLLHFFLSFPLLNTAEPYRHCWFSTQPSLPRLALLDLPLPRLPLSVLRSPSVLCSSDCDLLHLLPPRTLLSPVPQPPYGGAAVLLSAVWFCSLPLRLALNSATPLPRRPAGGSPGGSTVRLSAVLSLTVPSTLPRPSC